MGHAINSDEPQEFDLRNRRRAELPENLQPRQRRKLPLGFHRSLGHRHSRLPEENDWINLNDTKKIDSRINHSDDYWIDKSTILSNILYIIFAYQFMFLLVVIRDFRLDIFSLPFENWPSWLTDRPPSAFVDCSTRTRVDVKSWRKWLRCGLTEQATRRDARPLTLIANGESWCIRGRV